MAETVTWYREDDGLQSDPRYFAIDRRHRLACMGLRSLVGTWCARHRTDGHIPEYLPREYQGTPTVVRELVRVGFWDDDEATGGWLVRDWSATNKTKQQLDQETSNALERQRRSRESKAKADTLSRTTSEDPECHGVTDGVTDALVTPSVTAPYPVQSSPVPLSPSEKALPPRPGAPPKNWAGGVFATDPDIAAAAERWSQTPGKVAMQVGAKLNQLSPEYGNTLAEWVVRRALTDPDTRTLGRLDSNRVPGYLPDLLRQGRTALSAADRAPGAPRCQDHPENPARTCTACKGDIKAGQRDRADQGLRNSREDVAV